MGGGEGGGKEEKKKEFREKQIIHKIRILFYALMSVTKFKVLKCLFNVILSFFFVFSCCCCCCFCLVTLVIIHKINEKNF